MIDGTACADCAESIFEKKRHGEYFKGIYIQQLELSSLKRLFRKTPCDVFIANSGQEGLEVLAEHSIDVIISDARMPEMSGPEFLAVAAEQYPQTTRILLTGYADMEAVVDAINLGKVSHYVEKPWDDEKLQALVDDALIKINLKKKTNICSLWSRRRTKNSLL